MATNNENRVKRNSLNMIDLVEITDDELVGTTHFLVITLKVVPPEGGPIPENQPLSQRIGLCTNMTELVVVNCARLPPEISYCAMLSELRLFSHGNDGNDCRIELPEGTVLQNLTQVTVQGGGNWNTDEIISWLATFSPNLSSLYFYDVMKDTANQFMTSLQNNEAFLDQFQNKLEIVSFANCNLNEDDAREIIFDINPLYSRLVCIDLEENNIRSLETIATVVREIPPANDNPLLPSNLRFLSLKGNSFFDNLKVPESSDSAAMIDLLRYHPSLCQIGRHTDETIRYLPMIDYLLMMNRSGLRYLLDDGHGGTRLSGILPHVMNHAYTQSKQDPLAQDPTAVFIFLREGPIFRTQYQNNVVVVVDDNDNNDDSDDDDGDDDEYDWPLLLRHHH